MPRSLLTIDEIMAILPATVPRVASLTDGLSDAQLMARPEPAEDWGRVAVVTVAPGRSLEQTAHFFGDWLAGHEREHLEQMTRTIDRSRARD